MSNTTVIEVPAEVRASAQKVKVKLVMQPVQLPGKTQVTPSMIENYKKRIEAGRIK